MFKVRAVSRCSSSIAGHGEAILATTFSPSSSSAMVSGSGDSTARIWDCDTGTPVHTLKGHTSWVLVVGWSPDDSTIATGSMDNTVRLWDSQTGQPMGGPLKGHTKWVSSLAWEPYHLQEPGKPRIASASKDATVRIWDVISRRIEMVLSGHKGSVSCVRWGGTGLVYTSSHDKTVKVWNASNGTLAHTLSSHAHWVNHLALSTDFVLRTAYHDHTGDIPLTDTEKRKKAKERFEKAATINNTIVERLVTASDDFTMYLWEPSSSTKPVARLLGHQKQVNHVTFSPDGLFIASAGFDNHVKLWNARDGKSVNPFPNSLFQSFIPKDTRSGINQLNHVTDSYPLSEHTSRPSTRPASLQTHASSSARPKTRRSKYGKCEHVNWQWIYQVIKTRYMPWIGVRMGRRSGVGAEIGRSGYGDIRGNYNHRDCSELLICAF